MTNIVGYINDLLFLHDCVIVPGLGGFVANYKSSHLDEGRGVFYPPVKELSFNRSLTKNDGLLINWIVRREGISYEKAQKIAAYFAEDIKVKLNQGQRVVIENVGVLYTDRHFNILFEQTDYNFLTDSWGMQDVLLEYSSEDEQAGKSSGKISRALKYGVAASLFGGGMFVLGHNAEKIGNRGYKMPETASVSSIVVRSDKADRQDSKPEISPDTDMVDYDPFDDFSK